MAIMASVLSSQKRLWLTKHQASTTTTAKVQQPTRRVVTRSVTRHAAYLRSFFPFLNLPAEIRNLVYEFAIDVTAAQKVLDRYYQRCKDTHKISSIEAPLVWSKLPNLFRLNRQIYAEATFVLKKRSLVFDHGLLDLADVTDFVPKQLLRTISSITISDAGHPLLQDNILGDSFLGYMTLIEQLTDILGEGHNLKNLTISFGDEELIPHTTTCWNADFSCGFRDGLRVALNSLRKLRNVGCVTFNGIPDALAQELRARIEAPPVSFLDLPREIRDIIYQDCGDWSDITQQLFRTMADWTNKAKEPVYAKLSTPTVLLLNKQITAEVLPILRKKPLTLICPQDHDMQKQSLVPNVLHLITQRTLRNVQHIELKVESWEWVYSLDLLLPELAKSRNLRTIAFTFKDDLKARFLVTPNQQYPDTTLHDRLVVLAKMRGLQKASFAGDLPTCYTEPMAQVMQMTPSSTYELPKVFAIKGDGSMVEVNIPE